MPVKPKTYLSPRFRTWLRSLIEEKHRSINALALKAGVHQGNLNQGLLGQRDITDETLASIAPCLGMEPERLVTLADIDRIGGPERIRSYAPEALDPIAQVVEQLPENMEDPPTPWELRTLAAIGALDGENELDPRSGSYVWAMPREDRKIIILQAKRDWEEANKATEEVPRISNE